MRHTEALRTSQPSARLSQSLFWICCCELINITKKSSGCVGLRQNVAFSSVLFLVRKGVGMSSLQRRKNWTFSVHLFCFVLFCLWRGLLIDSYKVADWDQVLFYRVKSEHESHWIHHIHLRSSRSLGLVCFLLLWMHKLIVPPLSPTAYPAFYVRRILRRTLTWLVKQVSSPFYLISLSLLILLSPFSSLFLCPTQD